MKNFAIKGTSIIAAGLVCAAVIASGLSVIELADMPALWMKDLTLKFLW